MSCGVEKKRRGDELMKVLLLAMRGFNAGDSSERLFRTSPPKKERLRAAKKRTVKKKKGARKWDNQIEKGIGGDGELQLTEKRRENKDDKTRKKKTGKKRRGRRKTGGRR